MTGQLGLNEHKQICIEHCCVCLWFINNEWNLSNKAYFSVLTFAFFPLCFFLFFFFQRNTREWCNIPSLRVGKLLLPPPLSSAFQGNGRGMHAACAQFMASIMHPSLGMLSHRGTLQPSRCNSLAGEWTECPRWQLYRNKYFFWTE